MKEKDLIKIENYQMVKIANRILSKIMVGFDDIIEKGEYKQVIGTLTKWENDFSELIERETTES